MVDNKLSTKVELVIKRCDENETKFAVFDFQSSATAIQSESSEWQHNLFVFLLKRRSQYEGYQLISYEWVPKTGFTEARWKQIAEYNPEVIKPWELSHFGSGHCGF